MVLFFHKNVRINLKYYRVLYVIIHSFGVSSDDEKEKKKKRSDALFDHPMCGIGCDAGTFDLMYESISG